MIALNFKKELARLNPEQKLAVETIDGPVMVIAGPGTGKTQILTLRIANILAKTDTNPENILALTFTESATANMRRRLPSLIGTPSYYINIHTFHGFCNKLIQDYPENFPKIIGSTNANQVEQIQIVRKIIDENNFKNLKPFGNKYYYVSEILTDDYRLEQEKFQKFQEKAIQESSWLQLMLTIKFWMEDESAAFEKTDIFIEKSVNASFELMNVAPMNHLIDFGKFLFKENLSIQGACSL